MNVVVTGASGQLGSCLRLAAASASDRYIFASHADLDITDADAVGSFLDRNGADIVVNCAAYTNVDGAEDAPGEALALNADGPRNLAAAMKRRGGWLIHISTDYVFGGEMADRPLSELHPPCPAGVYGATKLEGERAVADTGVSALIIRTGWLYSKFGKNFLKTMLSLTSSRPRLSVVVDQCGTPTCAMSLAKAIAEIIDRRLYEGNQGIYHYAAEGVCSWFDFARTIAVMAGHTGCAVEPCSSAEYPAKARRPAYSVLDKTKFKQTFGIAVPYWTDALAECLNDMKTE